MKKHVKPIKKTIEKKKGSAVEEILNLLGLNETEKKGSKKPPQIDKKNKKEEPQDSIKEKKPLTKKEINELLNILDDIPEPKNNIWHDLKNKNYDNNHEPSNVLNIIAQKSNDYYQLKNKDELKDEKQGSSDSEHLSERENQPPVEKGVHHNLGLADINYFRKIIADNQGSIIFPISSFELEDVEGDGNCGYRALALQLYEDENYHYKIREDIYNYLKLNSSNFSHLNFQIDGSIIGSDEYIEKVKFDGFWMGDLEISVINKIYEATLYIYELREDQNFYLLSKYGDINDGTKLFLNLCFVNNNHYNVLYETKGGNLKINKRKLNEEYIEKLKKKNLKFVKDLEIQLEYVKDKRTITYEDILNFLKSKEKTGNGVYPDYIYKITDKNRRKNKKKDFKDSIEDYFIDKNTGRLKIKFNNTNIKNKIYKEYFIPYQIEKNNLIKNLHERTIHKGQNSLYELVKQENFWWCGIYEDVKEYIKNCPICQQIHKNVGRKPQIKQIITKGPRERYVVDLVDINEEINDNKKLYKYILNIIDHYSKLVGSYLLKHKSANEVLVKINDFIGHYGTPKILQTDHGKEFDNKLLKDYCNNNNIQLINSGVRHPTTNGVVEVVHKDIKNSLLAEKLKYKKNYDLNFSISNAARAHNTNIHSITKYSPEFLFNHNTEELTEEIEKKMKASQKFRRVDLNPIKDTSKVLVSTRYVLKGNNLGVKFGKTGKRLIPGIITGKGSGNTYPVSISINYKDLIKNRIYNIDYRLVKEVSDIVYNNILINFDNYNKDLNSESSEENDDK